MSTEAIVGCVLIALALGTITCLVLWSRRTINRIAESKAHSAREIIRDLHAR